MNKRIIPILVILLLLSSGFVGVSSQTFSEDVITVDDEGDGDYTSIKDAVDNATHGDTILVYSGIYPEDGIRIVKENITLLGISHELGGGNDSGKPFIKGNGTDIVIQVEASHVIVSNFQIERGPIYLGTDNLGNFNLNNIIISDCIIHNSKGGGIRVNNIGRDINIINNEINHCQYGIQAFESLNVNIKGNVMTDINYTGIYYSGGGDNISYNTIKRCNRGILVRCGNNIVYGNNIEDCSVGVISIGLGVGNTITKNNFKNYSLIGCWWERTVQIYLLNGLIKDKKDRWMGNYWDTWIGVGPKKIHGKLTLILGIHIYSDILIMIPIPWVDFDRRPAQEPYDIPAV